MTRASARRSALSLERLDGRDTPAAITAVGAAAGSAPIVTVYDAATKAQLYTISAYDASFTGGVSVAVGDVNGDGTPDVITGAGAGGGSTVNVFNGKDGSPLFSLTAGDADSRAGVNVAAADYDKDGKADLVVGTVQGGQPLVQVLGGTEGSKVLHQFTPFVGTSAPSVAAGDVNGDGTPDVIVASGAGAAPRVTVFSGANETALMDFYAFEQSFTGGVSVAAGDLNSDGKADIVTAAGKGGGPRIQAFAGGTGAVLLNFFAYDPAQRNGVRADAADADGDGRLDVVAADGGGVSGLTAFDGRTGSSLTAPTFAGLPVDSDFDRTAPTVTISSTAAAAVRTAPLAFTATFSEVVNGFTADDLTVTNGTVSDFTAADGRTYTFKVTPAADGAVTVRVAAGVAADAAGNGNVASSTFTRTYDTTAPAVTATALTTGDTTPTLTGTVDDSSATVVVTAGGQTVTATVSGTTWTATLPTALADGTYDVTATATDPAGNSRPTTLAGGLVVNSTLLTVTVTSPTGTTPTKTSPLQFAVTFSQAVTGFTAANVTVSNGTATAATTSDSKTYLVTVTPTGQGAVSVSVAAGVARTAVGTANQASNTLSRVYDTVAPSVAATAQKTNDTTPTLAGTVTDATATVSVSVLNGQTVVATVAATVAASTTAGGSATWTATVPTALAAGTYDLKVTATDPAGNVGNATAAGGLVVDTAAPTVNVATTASNPTATSPVPFTVTFSEDVTGFNVADLVITNGSATAFAAASPRVYTFNVVPAATGAVTVTVPAAAAADAAGNANTAGSRTVTFSGTAVTTTLTSVGTPTRADSFPVTVTFSAAVTGFNASDVQVTRGTVSNFTPSTTDPKSYSFTVTPTADGDVVVSVPAAAATDALGNLTAAATLTVTSDRTAPTAAIAAGNYTGTNPITFTVNFSEAVNTLPASALAATNGTVGAVTAVNAKTYRVVVTPTSGSSPVTLTVQAGTVADTSGNVTATAYTGAANPGTDSAGLSNTIPLVDSSFTTRSNGLRVKDVTAGTGATAAVGNTITVQYTLWLTDGTRVQSSVDSSPFTTRLAATTATMPGVIQGWVEGIPGMQVGGIRDLYIPAALGYGSQERTGIPANSDLVFEVKLLAVSTS